MNKMFGKIGVKRALKGSQRGQKVNKMEIENVDIADLYQTYFGYEIFHNNCTNCILVAHELHNGWKGKGIRCILQLLGDFGDYLAILCERHKIRRENLPCITELFRSGFGYRR